MSGVSLFKTPEAIDEMWANQQRHLEYIQDPPDMSMYTVAGRTSISCGCVLLQMSAWKWQPGRNQQPPQFSATQFQEDACGQNLLPGFKKLQVFCSLLVKIGLTEDKLSLTTEASLFFHHSHR